jgi:hypothetical protein
MSSSRRGPGTTPSSTAPYSRSSACLPADQIIGSPREIFGPLEGEVVQAVDDQTRIVDIHDNESVTRRSLDVKTETTRWRTIRTRPSHRQHLRPQRRPFGPQKCRQDPSDHLLQPGPPDRRTGLTDTRIGWTRTVLRRRSKSGPGGGYTKTVPIVRFLPSRMAEGGCPPISVNRKFAF